MKCIHGRNYYGESEWPAHFSRRLIERRLGKDRREREKEKKKNTRFRNDSGGKRAFHGGVRAKRFFSLSLFLSLHAYLCVSFVCEIARACAAWNAMELKRLVEIIIETYLWFFFFFFLIWIQIKFFLFEFLLGGNYPIIIRALQKIVFQRTLIMEKIFFQYFFSLEFYSWNAMEYSD